MSHIPCIQGSPEWLQERCGRITASRIVDVLAVLKRGGESAARENYRMELIAEKLTGRSASHFVTTEMQWGVDNELLARGAYEVETGNSVDMCGFFVHPEMEFAGASPDGLVDGGGLLEIKCPQTKTHLRWMLAGVVPPEHEPQMLFEMACTGRKWCDFASFDPRLPANLQLFIRRLEWDDSRIKDIEDAVVFMDAEVNAILNLLCPPSASTPVDSVLAGALLTDKDFEGLISTQGA
jgi:putative phage-type endonuclease